EREVRQILERTESYVAPLPVAGHDVLAGIDADVSDTGAKPSQFGAPTAFSGPDVQYGSQIAAEKVFRRTDDHTHLSADRLRGVNPRSRITVPSVEVCFIVRLAAGMRRRLG